MGVLERSVGNLIPEAFKRPFPIKARNLEEFADLVMARKGLYVEAELVRLNPRIKASTSAVGVIGDFRYQAVFTSRAQDGRKIILKSPFFKAFQSEYGFADRNLRDVLALKGFITIDAMLRKIKETVPIYTRVDLVKGDGSVFKDEELKAMRADARRRNIEPSDF